MSFMGTVLTPIHANGMLIGMAVTLIEANATLMGVPCDVKGAKLLLLDGVQLGCSWNILLSFLLKMDSRDINFGPGPIPSA